MMIQSGALKATGLAHGFFTREGGHSAGLYASLNCGLGSGDDRHLVRRNRSAVADQLGIDEPSLLTTFQYHSSDVIEVAAPWDADRRPKADAMVTRHAGIGLGILTADCGPVLFADLKAGVIGAAHAGWKGALSGVTGRTLAAMESLGARRADVVAVIGPAISIDAYEVGPEFAQRFLDEDAGNVRFFRPSERPAHAMFDLPGYLEERLRREGAGDVVNLDVCTFSDEPRFFSYRRTTHRRETDYGRQISAIALT